MAGEEAAHMGFNRLDRLFIGRAVFHAADHPNFQAVHDRRSSRLSTSTEFATVEYATPPVERRLTLDRCRQTHLDAWIVEHTTAERNGLRGFLHWAARNKLARPLELPPTQPQRGTPLTARERMTLLGRMLTDESCPLRTRVAATLVLLYVQPVSRLVRLDLDDVLIDDGQVTIRFGDPPTPVPEPFAALLLDYIAHRTNMRTAPNPDSRWLFPGRRASRPLRPEWLAKQITQTGVPTTAAARGAALRQHLQDSPAPIVADALGFHPVTTTTTQATN